MTPVDLVLQHIKLPFPLREYQIEDANNLAPVTHSGLFNDMGLGKTVTSFIIACYKILMKEVKGCYVVCPAQLVTQWQIFLEQTGVDSVAYKGTPAARKKINIDQDFIVMSYQIFIQDYERLRRDDFFFIFDEATVFCNTQNITYKVFNGGVVSKVKNIPGKLKPEISKVQYPRINKTCCLLTGTPINNPVHAYGLINVKTPDIYRSFDHFKRIHIAEEDPFGAPSVFQNMNLLKENLMLNSVRRLISDHIDLPPIIYNTILYDLPPEHMKLYDKLVEDRMLEVDGSILVDAISAQGLYQASQQIIISPSIGGLKSEPEIFDLLDLHISQVGQFIIFANYINNNKAFVKKFNIGGVFGEISRANKDKNIDLFQKGELRGLSIQYRSGGSGLNLQNCNTVFFPELPVTPRDFRQCVARVYRSGQKNRVVVTIFVARNTIQQHLLKRIFDKDELSQEIINESDTLSDVLTSNVKEGKLTKEELMVRLKGRS